MQRASLDSEKTFKEYQQECRKREQQLLQDLERAYHNHKCTDWNYPEQTNKIYELEMQVEELNNLKQKVRQL